MTQPVRELVAVLRCLRHGARFGTAVRFATRGAPEVVRAFHRVVAPIVDETMTDPAEREQTRDALLFGGVKASFLISSYAAALPVEFPVELSALGGAFTRLYDDLIDDVDADWETANTAERLGDLFGGRPFSPATDFEALLQRLHGQIAARLDRPGDDPIHLALAELHEFQVRSRAQKDASLNSYTLSKITAGKGGLANVALLGLVRPRMGPRERDLIMELGEALQLLDDYVDVHLDRRAGITTAVTRGEVGLVEVADRLRSMYPRLLSTYGHEHGRQFVGVLSIMVMAAWLRRTKPARFERAAPPRAGKHRALWLLTHRGDGVRPRSGPR